MQFPTCFACPAAASSARSVATRVTLASRRGRAERSRCGPVGWASSDRPVHMLTHALRLDRLPPADPVLPPPTAPGVEVWRNAEGVLSAVGFPTDGGHGVHVPGIGTFCFTAGAPVMQLRPVPGADERLVAEAYYRIALPLAIQYSGRQVLHASAVVLPSGVVAFSGRAGAGKSTLAFALSRMGHSLFADDVVAFEAAERPVGVLPLPFRLRLRQEAAEWFSTPELLKGREGSSTWITGEPAPLLAVVLPERPAGAEPDWFEMARLPAADAFAALLQHAYYVVTDDADRTRRMVSAYLELADRVPVFALRYHPTLTILDDLAHEVERRLAESAPS